MILGKKWNFQNILTKKFRGKYEIKQKHVKENIVKTVEQILNL